MKAGLGLIISGIVVFAGAMLWQILAFDTGPSASTTKLVKNVNPPLIVSTLGNILIAIGLVVLWHYRRRRP